MLGFVDVMMRVPPIMVIDEILKIGMGLPTRLYPDKVTGTESLTTVEAVNSNRARSTTVAFRSVKAFFGIGSDVSTTDSVAAAVTASVSASINNNSQEILEQTIEDASKSANVNGMLSTNFNTLMDELAHDDMLANILSITTVKFVICLLGKSSLYQIIGVGGGRCNNRPNQLLSIGL